MLSVEQIATRLDDRFRLLTGGSRTALPRQQTLRAMIDWSYSLLSEPERILFKRLAVFVSGWTLEAAEVVCSGDSIEPPAVLDLLTRLVDKSLVMMEELAGETRYRRLETIRQYSREKFFETDEVETVRDRHLEFYVQFTEIADEHMQSRERKAWTHRLEAEQDNMRAALEWGLARNPDSALRIAAAVAVFWTGGGYAAEGHRWTQQALERVEATSPPQGTDGQQRLIARAKALRALAWLYVSQGDNENGRLVAEQSVALYRQGEDRRGLAFALVGLAMPLEFLGRRAEAETLLKESIALARPAGDAYVACSALNNLARVTADLHGDLDAARGYVDEGMRLSRAAGLLWLTSVSVQMLGTIALHRKDYVEARARFEEAMVAFQEVGAPFNAILAKSDLAHLERNQGNHARALELYCETIVAFRDVGQRGAVAHQLECFAFIAVAQNQCGRALRLLGAAEAMRAQSGTPMTPDEQIDYQKQVEVLREHTDSELFTKTWAEGRALTMEHAIQYATEADSVLRA